MTEFNLGTWANIAEIIGAGSIITGLIVGWIQIRHLRRQQELREDQHQPSWGEWFEWLGNQAVKRKTSSEPAHILHKNWKP